MPFRRKVAIPKQKIDLWSQKKIKFWGQIALFRPQRPIGASTINTFNTKHVSNWLSDIRVPKFLLPILKIRNFGKNTAKFGQNWHFQSFQAKNLPIWQDAYLLFGQFYAFKKPLQSNNFVDVDSSLPPFLIMLKTELLVQEGLPQQDVRGCPFIT